MKLAKLYNLLEAGVLNKGGAEPKKKKSSHFKHANGGAMGSADDEEDDEDELGPDADYEDPSPDEPASAEPEPVRPAKPFKEPEKEVPFARQSAKPSPAMQGGKTAGSISADAATLGALQKALESVRSGDDDLMDWIEDVVREISRAVKSGGQLTLPKFEATPSLDTFDDDDGGSEEEDY